MRSHTLILKSCSQSICQLEDLVTQLSKEYHITTDKYPDILISLTEAVNNAIIHGNLSDEKKMVRIEWRHTGQALSFRVTDEGAGFDPQAVPDPTAQENISCCGGRGVYLMRQLADEVSYCDKGSQVTISFAV